MKAIVATRYGSPDVLQVQEVAKPVPRDDEVLIRIHATTVTAGDCEVRSSRVLVWFWLFFRLYMGILKPRKGVLGQELAGEIEAAGKGVTQFKRGDQVFATTGMRFGAHAEFICLPSGYPIATKPANMTYEEAAAVPVGGLNALHFLRRGDIQRGQKVLINGAGGSIGTYAVQIAKSMGAEVTGVDSTGKLAMLGSIGADHVIDYTREDFTRNGETYDVILDVVGKSSHSRSLRALKDRGHLLIANPSLSRMVRGRWTSMTTGKKVTIGGASYETEDLIHLKQIIEAGDLKSVIDRRYPLEQAAKAHRYVETGLKKGNVVLTVEHNSG